MTDYNEGRKLEYALTATGKKPGVLRVNGYEVIRSAGSKGKIDVMAFKQGEILFVQCKRSGRIGPAERAELIRLAAMVGATPLAARWLEPGRPSLGVAFDELIGTGPKDHVNWSPDWALETRRALVVEGGAL